MFELAGNLLAGGDIAQPGDFGYQADDALQRVLCMMTELAQVEVQGASASSGPGWTPGSAKSGCTGRQTKDRRGFSVEATCDMSVAS